MRFQFTDARRVRRLARSLKDDLSARGVDWPLSRCREAVAAACGYPTFHEAEAAAGKGVPSVVDEGCAPAEVAARRAIQGAALLRHGLDPILVDGVLDRVGLTAARRAGAGAPSDPVAHAATPRQLRVEARSRLGTSPRAGNFHAFAIVDDDCNFLGLGMGSDSSVETDDPPEALYEALGVRDGAMTVGEATMRPVGALRVLFADLRGEGSDELGTVLHLGLEADELRPDQVRIPRSAFAPDHYHRPWRSNSRDADAGVFTAWGYSRAYMVGHSDEARGRVRELFAAAKSNGLAFVFTRMRGLTVLLADKFDPDTSLDDVVRAIGEADRSGPPLPRGGDLCIGSEFAPRMSPAPV